MNKFYLLLLAFLASFSLTAGEVDVINVTADCNKTCRFDVTVKHADTGWDHYVNKWDVLTPDGDILATRVLYHPHVNEQPFTRSLGSVVIPAGIDSVIIRASDSVHKTGGEEFTVNIHK